MSSLSRISALAIAAGTTLGGCSDIYYDRRETVALGADDHIASNRVAQMVDPLAALLLDEASRHELERPDDKLLARYRWESAGADLAAFYRELARP